MTGDSTTSRCGEQRQQRLPQHPIKTDEIEILESAGGEDTQPDKVERFVGFFYVINITFRELQ